MQGRLRTYRRRAESNNEDKAGETDKPSHSKGLYHSSAFQSPFFISEDKRLRVGEGRNHPDCQLDGPFALHTIWIDLSRFYFTIGECWIYYSAA